MFRYSVYGLELASDTVLPELTSLAAPEEAVVQIKVRLQLDGRRDPGVPRWILHSALPNGDDWALYGKIEGGYLLRYVGLADFIVECRGHELTCARIEPGTSAQTLRHLLLDQVLPLVLNLLGCDVLHASAVATPAGICAFIGPAGQVNQLWLQALLRLAIPYSATTAWCFGASVRSLASQAIPECGYGVIHRPLWGIGGSNRAR